MISLALVVGGLVALVLAGWWLWTYRSERDAERTTRHVSRRLAGIVVAFTASIIVVLESGAIVLSSVGDILAAYMPWLANGLVTIVGALALEGRLDVGPTVFVGLATGIAIAAVMLRR